MSDIDRKAQFEKAVDYLNKWMKVVNGFDDGLDKVHSLILSTQQRVDELFEAALNGVMSIGELVSQYRDEVYRKVDEEEAKIYGTKDNSDEEIKPTHEIVGGRSEKTLEQMTREEKIEYFINGYQIDSNSATIKRLMHASDSFLDAGIKILKKNGK